MPEDAIDDLESVIADVTRALARCDAAGVGLAASVHLDLGLQRLLAERDACAAVRTAVPAD